MFADIVQYGMYWLDCLSWSFHFLEDLLWDPRSILLFLVTWGGMAAKEWHDKDWKTAGLAVVMKGAILIKAIKWSAFAFVGLFIVIVFFVAPAQKYQTLEASYKTEQATANEIRTNLTTAQNDLTNARNENKELRGTTEQLQEANANLQRDNQSLRDPLKLAQASLFTPYVDVINTYLHEEPNEAWVILLVKNLGQTQLTLLSSETTFFIAGQEYIRDKYSTPVLLRPNSQPFEFPVRIPKDIFLDVKNGKTILTGTFEYTYKGVLNDERVSCFGFQFGGKKNKYERPGPIPKECKKSVAKRKIAN